MKAAQSMADDILDGVFCQECGEYLGEATGYPRYCSDCDPVSVKKYKSKPAKVEKLPAVKP